MIYIPEGRRPEGMLITVETDSRVMQPTCTITKALNNWLELKIGTAMVQLL